MRQKDDKSPGVQAQDGQTDKPSAGVGLDSQLQAQIGRKLKAMYDSYLNEPIPDHLVSLLEKLDEQTRGDQKGAKE
ncbi:NepR family anti-sigma factor [Amorphus sp. 3PC139-8]|uniref:NepR family anti-sigma factor n=1 Tax=Amorphus sp. 3PC139-8 TaxID=2735676 RepID=UPI00345C6CD5